MVKKCNYKMWEYEKYKLIYLTDKSFFEPAIKLNEKTGNYKDACEKLIPLYDYIQSKNSSLEDGRELLDEDTPVEFRPVFDCLDDVSYDDVRFVLDGIENILSDRILFAMRKGLENGTISKGDFEPLGDD